MRYVEIVPTGRSKEDKTMYQFLDWFYRKHKDVIKDDAEKMIWLMITYGDTRMGEMYENTKRDT